MVNLKGDIWIEGFDAECLLGSFEYGLFSLMIKKIYAGRTEDIPEEFSRNIVRDIVLSTGVFYINYRKMAALKDHIENRRVWHNQIVWEPMCKTAKESILTACNKPYCIIFKK